MIKAFTSSILTKNVLFIKVININKSIMLSQKSSYNFASITQKLQNKQTQKSQQEIRKQIQHLANKPSFTLMDYKQRILDELNKINSSLKAKFSTAAQQQAKQLQLEKKVLSCIYETELNQQKILKHGQKQAISLISQVEYAKVTAILKKAERYKKMHMLLRSVKQKGQPLPNDMQELNYMYIRSGLEHRGVHTRYDKYQQRSRIQKGRYIKWKKE